MKYCKIPILSSDGMDTPQNFNAACGMLLNAGAAGPVGQREKCPRYFMSLISLFHVYVNS